MITKSALAILLLLPLLAASGAAHASPYNRNDSGRQIAAPPWSFACITDHGPAPCDQLIWAYGNVN
jgi:hypothetical protein